MFYVYEYYNLSTQEVFYVGKGTRDRYKQISGRNEDFLEYIKNNKYKVRIVKTFENEDDAFAYEKELITFYRERGNYLCNKNFGGLGGVAGVWTDEKRAYQSQFNPMKEEEQRKRMHENNPSFKKETYINKAIRNNTLFTFYGETFYLLKDFANKWGISTTTAKKWLNRLEIIEKTIPFPENPNGPFTDREKAKIKSALLSGSLKGKPATRITKEISLFGVQYESISEAKNTLDILTYSTISRLKEDEEKILEKLPQLFGQKRALTEEEKRIIFSRNKASQDKNKKALSIDGIVYSCANEASRALDIKANTIRSRCINKNFPSYYFL